MKKTFTQKEIQNIALEILDFLKAKSYKLKADKATVVALSGDLGAGKTTLTQAIARELGIKENIISPTFVIMKNYEISNEAKKLMKLAKLVHIDAYRFEKSDELLKLGWQELISDPKNLILIEWPERVAEIISKDAIRVLLSHTRPVRDRELSSATDSTTKQREPISNGKDEEMRHIDIS